MTFAPGDIVALKSGGHSMTVVSAEENGIECLWLGDAGELFRQSIPAVALTMIESSEAQDDAEEEAEDEDEDEDDEDEDDEDEDEHHDDDEDKEREEKRRAKGR
jgi:uncharacterized protein YodC (DUF2158 family)